VHHGGGRGHLAVLQWLRANGCPWDENTCSQAAWVGHLAVLQWARANGCAWKRVERGAAGLTTRRAAAARNAHGIVSRYVGVHRMVFRPTERLQYVLATRRLQCGALEYSLAIRSAQQGIEFPVGGQAMHHHRVRRHGAVQQLGDQPAEQRDQVPRSGRRDRQAVRDNDKRPSSSAAGYVVFSSRSCGTHACLCRKTPTKTYCSLS
jgi:hypothetical protein